MRASMPEAQLEDSGSGLAPASDGWFVVNVRDVEWWVSKTFGSGCVFEGEAAHFAQLGINIAVLEPGEPNCLYHTESQQEAFLVLSGECKVLVNGEERLLRAVGLLPLSRGNRARFRRRRRRAVRDPDDRCADEGRAALYPVSELAARYGASAEKETPEPREAYAPFERATRGRPSYWNRLPWA